MAPGTAFKWLFIYKNKPQRPWCISRHTTATIALLISYWTRWITKCLRKIQYYTAHCRNIPRQREIRLATAAERCATQFSQRYRESVLGISSQLEDFEMMTVLLTHGQTRYYDTIGESIDSSRHSSQGKLLNALKDGIKGSMPRLFGSFWIRACSPERGKKVPIMNCWISLPGKEMIRSLACTRMIK